MSKKLINSTLPYQPFPLLAEAFERFESESVAPTSITALRCFWIKVAEFVFKRAATRLRNHLNTKHNIELSHGQLLNALSASLGVSDWNTAKAGIAQLVDSELVPSARLALSDCSIKPNAPNTNFRLIKKLSKELDFQSSVLIAGCTGCGKSLAAKEATKAFLQCQDNTRPLLVTTVEPNHSPDGWAALIKSDLMPGSNAILQHNSIGDSAAWKSCISKQFVAFLDESIGTEKAGDGQAKKAAATRCFNLLNDWVAKGLRPILIVDEPGYLFGEEAGSWLLNQLPLEVTVVWIEQAIESTPLSTNQHIFDKIALMRNYHWRYDSLEKLNHLGVDDTTAKSALDLRQELCTGQALMVSPSRSRQPTPN